MGDGCRYSLKLVESTSDSERETYAEVSEVHTYIKLCVADSVTRKTDKTEASSRNAKPRGGLARRRKEWKAEGLGCRVASRICNQHSAAPSDVTSGHLPNKQKPRNRTLSAGETISKKKRSWPTSEHVSSGKEHEGVARPRHTAR